MFLPWFYYVYIYCTWYVIWVYCISVLFVGEFDELISALRTGDVFGEDLMKMRRNRKRGGLSVGHGRERGGKLWIHLEAISERRKVDWFCSQASLGQKPATGPCFVNLLIDSLMNHYLCFRTKYEIVTEFACISLKVLDI